MAYEALKLAVENQTAVVTLNLPDKRNAITPRMLEELQPLLATHLPGAEVNQLRNYPSPRDLSGAIGGGAVVTTGAGGGGGGGGAG